jgi:hypothetical protein
MLEKLAKALKVKVGGCWTSGWAGCLILGQC